MKYLLLCVALGIPMSALGQDGEIDADEDR
jgi:hypothetical protein